MTIRAAIRHAVLALAVAATPAVAGDGVLDLVDRVVAASPGDRATIEAVTGLAFRRHGPDWHAGPGGSVVSAELRTSGLLILTLPPDPCLRPDAIHARYGIEHGLTPVSPHRALPAPWYLTYHAGAVRTAFGFLMTEPHRFDGCLVEIVIDWSRLS